MRFVLIMIITLLFITGCADTVDFTLTKEVETVGFWYGLWHGMIAWIAFFISLFDDSVSVYAVYNNGGWYDFGYLIGVVSIWGGGCKMKCKTGAQKRREDEWKEVGDKVEIKIMHKLKEWAEDENDTASRAEWDEIGDKVEKKLKRKIREWAEKE